MSGRPLRRAQRTKLGWIYKRGRSWLYRTPCGRWHRLGDTKPAALASLRLLKAQASFVNAIPPGKVDDAPAAPRRRKAGHGWPAQGPRMDRQTLAEVERELQLPKPGTLPVAALDALL